MLEEFVMSCAQETAQRNAEELDIDGAEGAGEEDQINEDVEIGMSMIHNVWETGILHMICETEVIASKEGRMVKRVLIDYAYDYLKKNFSQTVKTVFDHIPRNRTLKIGMTYELL